VRDTSNKNENALAKAGGVDFCEGRMWRPVFDTDPFFYGSLTAFGGATGGANETGKRFYEKVGG
jgi:hypothetical protein